MNRYAVKIAYLVRMAWSYLDGSQARRGREFDEMTAAITHRNRSNGAKRGWAARKAREAADRGKVELYVDHESDVADVA